MSNSRTLSSFTLIVTFVCLALIGLALVPLLPVKLAPSRVLPGLTISFRMPGNSSRVIEAEVTSKLESMLARVNGIKNVISTSDNGGGSITLELDKHADIDAARLKCQPLSAKRGRSCLTESAILRLVPAVRMIKHRGHL